MKRYRIFLLGSILLLLVFQPHSLLAEDEDLYSFDVEEFEKKTWEWNGSVYGYGRQKVFNRDSVLYPIKFPDSDRQQSAEAELQLSLESRWDLDWSRLFISGESSVTRAEEESFDDDTTFLGEAYWQFLSFEPHSIEIGKRLLRWGKGYAFNPVAFMERPKNPEDPEAAREGLWILQGIWIPGATLFFETVSINLVYLPVNEDINDDFQIGLEEENLWGLKLYGLVGKTDIDLYFVHRTEAGETDKGIDFATNITTNFEIHGELAYFESDGSFEHLGMIGTRYLTETDITLIIELYQDSSGLTSTELEDSYRMIDSIPVSKAKPFLAMIQQSKTISRNYGYLKASVKEPFDILYLTPSISWLGNLDDNSFTASVGALYTPIDNWAFQFTWQRLNGGQYTQYGENVVGEKAEIGVSYNF